MHLTDWHRQQAAGIAAAIPLVACTRIIARGNSLVAENDEAEPALDRGQRIVDTCHDIARRQYEDDAAGAAKCEIDLLRTKVLELSKSMQQLRADMREQAVEFRRELAEVDATIGSAA